jgi:hypothetical protein
LVDGTSATPIAQVAATSSVDLVADATERDLARVVVGRPAHMQLAPGTPPINGSVSAVSSGLDPTTGLGQVRIGFESRVPSLIGARGKVTISIRQREGVLLAPIEALRGAVTDGAEVVTCENGKAQVRSVQVGFRDDRRFEIVSGVTEDQKLAIDHVLGLETGTRITESQ